MRNTRTRKTAAVTPAAAILPACGEGRPLEDQTLLARIVAGDRAAFDEFYHRHAPRLLGLLLRQLRHRADAEDVLQETFQQVWRTGAQYRADRASPEVWLSMIARSRLLDWIRRRRAMSRQAVALATSHARDPAAEFGRHELAARIHGALADLPEPQRVAITLSYFAGLTHVQIADRQGIPLGTAKTRILLGIRTLRRRLASLEEVAP